MLAERDRLNTEIQRILDQQTDAWGIKVSNVELKHIDLNETMVRAIAKQAEAERLRRAKIIDAEGEFQAAERLASAVKFPRAALKRCSFAIWVHCSILPGKTAPPLCSRSRSIWASP